MFCVILLCLSWNAVYAEYATNYPFKITTKKPFNMTELNISQKVEELRAQVVKAKNIVLYFGSGIGTESGVPSYVNTGGFDHRYYVYQIEHTKAFEQNATLVWEFYHNRLELVKPLKPHKGYYVVKEFQQRVEDDERQKLTIVTHNLDGFLRKFCKDVIELQGSYSLTQCTKCKRIAEYPEICPICKAMAKTKKGRRTFDTIGTLEMPESDLPHCRLRSCKGMLRPYLAWLTDELPLETFKKADEAFQKCDLAVFIGLTTFVYNRPPDDYAKLLKQRGVPFAEVSNHKRKPWLRNPYPNYFIWGDMRNILQDVLNVYLDGDYIQNYDAE